MEEKNYEEVLELFKTLSKYEKKAEEYRQELAALANFKIYAAFCDIDFMKKGYIVPHDIFLFLRKYKGREMLLMESFRFKNREFPARANFAHFKGMVLPACDPVLRQDVLDRKLDQISSFETLPYRVGEALARFFDNEVKCNIEAERIRKRIKKIPDPPFHIFQYIDSQNNHYIAEEDIEELFSTSGHPLPTESEVQGILRRLDADEDGKVSFLDFLDVTAPFQGEAVEKSYYSPLKTLISFIDNTQNISPPEDYQPAIIEHSAYPMRRKERYQDSLAPESCFKSSAGFPRSDNKIFQTPNPVRWNKIEEDSEKIEKKSEETKAPTVNIKKPIGEEGQKIIQLFKRQIELDNQLEEMKLNLFLQEDISIPLAYAFLSDGDEKGVSAETMKKKLGEFSIENAKIIHIFRRYNKKGDWLLSREDIASMLMPQYQESLHKLTKKKDDESSSKAFGEKTRELFGILLKGLLQTEIDLDKLRADTCEEFTKQGLTTTFQEWTCQCTALFKKEDIKSLLSCSDSDAEALLMRYDKDRDDGISFYEFVGELTQKVAT